MDGARPAPDPLADRYVRRNIAMLAAIENTPASALGSRADLAVPWPARPLCTIAPD